VLQPSQLRATITIISLHVNSKHREGYLVSSL